MDSIYKLQQRASALRDKTQIDSITPEEVGGLHFDTLAYLADMEQNLDGLGIRKVYVSVAAMNADKSPIGTNGKALRLGQLVTIYNASAPTAQGTGNVYAYQKPGWLLVGNIGGIYELKAQIEAETSARQAAVTTLEEALSEIEETIASIIREVGTIQLAISDINTRLSGLSGEFATFKNSVGKAGGIAPLDDSGKIPSRYVPGTLDDVVEFDDIIESCTIEPRELPELGVEGLYTPIYYCSAVNYFVVFNPEDSMYYTNWVGDELFQSLYKPLRGKVFLCKGDGKSYRWSGSQLAVIGSDLALGMTERTAYPGDRGAVIENEIDRLWENVSDFGRSFVNINTWKGITETITLDEAINHLLNASRIQKGIVISLFTIDGWITKQYIGEESLTAFQNHDNWKDFGNGGAAVGNIYNVTNEVPISGYYELCDPNNPTVSAVHVAWEMGMAVSGLIISFEIASGIWKTYQYTGRTLTEDNWKTLDNWKDFGSLAAGSETHIVIDTLVGAPSVGQFYTLESAVTALLAYQKEKGVTYAKPGLVISYKVAENSMETKQFQGAVSDFGEVALWKDFGGGGSKVELGDAPEEGGEKALSTGGAYDCIPVDFTLDTETEGVVKIQMVNAKGEGVGEEKQFLVGTGGGGGGGTIVAIAFENSPVYGAYGATIKARAAIRSVTSGGGIETENSIETLEIVDRDSGLTVWTERVNKQSSGDLTDYTFELDFTQFFTAAGARKFKLVAIDDAGNTGSKNIAVTAVDVTCTCVQVLQYSADMLITPKTESVSIPLYKFANNQSDKGISAQIDIKIGGAWQPLATATINDSFTHSITLRPADLGLHHGSYPLRIQGTDIASGTTGNIIYTAIMVVEEGNATPIVSLRYDDKTGGNIRLYDTVAIDIAAYTPDKTQTYVSVMANGVQITQLNALPTRSYQVTQQVQGYKSDGSESITYQASTGNVSSDSVVLTVKGSAIEAQPKEGALYSFDFSSRSNSEADHSIVSNGYQMTLTGANYTTNGFGNFLGENCLRVAENVKASLPHYPFAASSIEATGTAIQFAFAAKNIKDEKSRLIECYDPTTGAGFYVTGNKVAIFCKNGVQALEERSYRQGEKITVGIVVEPSTIYYERSGVKYSLMKMYLNGEMVACIGYVAGSGNLLQEKNITMDGTDGDLYLYYMMAWNSYYEWAQAFENYLVKLTDTTAMVEEYNFENVLVSQTAEGSTKSRPSAAALYARGIPYVVLVASEEAHNEFDNGTSTSDNFPMDVYYYDPVRPWRSFKATQARIRRQGTTSAKRPKKNVRIYLEKAKSIVPLYSDYTNEDALLTYALFAEGKVRVGENTIPVDLITIKIDFSDSSNSNDCSVCDMMNATYAGLGGRYLTPAQRAYDGTYDIGDVHIDGLEMNHSTANHSIAVFRSTDSTLQNIYYEAKGNWKEDKGEQQALGFYNTPGYNKGCLNYQDESFIEFFGQRDETLDAIEARFKTTEGLDTSMPYLLSLYCGRDYRFMRYKNGAWKASTGSMKQINGKWVVEGDVLNPVTGFELLNYQGMDWFKGVSSIDDMMAPSTYISSWVKKLVDKGEISGDAFPAWTFYFECMVDNDQLAIDFALGKKVPYDLYRFLRFCDAHDYEKYTDWQESWKRNFHRYASVESAYAYTGFTDYRAATDQRAKNMQPMWFLEEGFYVENGIYKSTDSSYTGDDAVRMYLNKVYDADTTDGKDNDGGCTVDPEVDPNKENSETFTNPYAGHGSILFKNINTQQVAWIDNVGTELALRTTIAAMRNVQCTVDGMTLNPFSPQGAMYYSVEKRLKFWPKMVSSYDGERKYIQYTATSDAIYFYALQGLGLTALPSFIEKRWRIRDGYYQTGDFFTGVLSGRIACGSDAKIRIVAAKTGFFGVGNDASGNLSESCFLEAGQEYTFTNFSHEEGALLYIYQADRMREIDLSQISLDANFSFSVMTLCERLILGSDSHIEYPIKSYAPLSMLNLGELPFLVHLDIKNTGAKSLDASQCPRIEHIYAQGSALESITLAETSPINDIALPNTMVELRFIGLPMLTYKGLSASSGLQMTNLPAVQRLRIETSPKLDAIRMLADVLSSQSASRALTLLRIVGQTLKGDATELLTVIERGVAGQDADGNKVSKPVIDGTYQLTVILEDYEIEALENGISEMTILVVIEAYIDLIDDVNAEGYGGAEEVENVTLDNIDEHLLYYNGETYEQYLSGYADENADINDIINS
ncbi:MAG: hypothetical protein Q4F44_01715 [Bacteroidales bacterium]|nr:hypothetical protein [Bacteroidales bacterium]